MNGTLQDRLATALRLRSIKSMDARDAFSVLFIADFNARFAKMRKRDFNAHRPLRRDEKPSEHFLREQMARLTLQ